MLYTLFLFILLLLCFHYTGIVVLNLVWLSLKPSEKVLKHVVDLIACTAFLWTLFYFCK